MIDKLRFLLQFARSALVLPVVTGVIIAGNASTEAQTTDKESTLYRHLQAQAVQHLEARAVKRKATMTADQVAGQVKITHDWFNKALGPWPEKTPLNAKVTGTIEGAGIRAEKILFESRPGHHVSAVLYLPNTPAPWPGVIVPCGHSANGKAAETYQRVSILLAQAGMAALCYDPIGQGERVQALKTDGKPLFGGSTTEHTRIANGSLLVGLQTAHYRVWDGIRALDYLASRPDIDKTRLGCTGNSGGGTLTSFLMAVDDRIAVAAASCYLTSYERLLATIGPQDAEQNITGMIADGLDHGDFILARAPKPTMMAVATRDFFDIDGAWTTYREAKKLYGALGYGERAELFEFDDTHGFSMPRRVASVRWLRRWLLNQNDGFTEPEFSIFTDAQLQTSPTGQVLNLENEKSVFEINAEKAAALAKARKKRSDAALRTAIRNRLHLEPIAKNASYRPDVNRGSLLQFGHYTTSDNFELAAVRFHLKNGAVVAKDAQANESPMTVIVGSEIPVDKWNIDVAKAFIAKQAGKIVEGDVVVLDVRGTGSSGSPAASAARSRDPNGPDWREAELARLLNQNLVGLRTRDLIEVLGSESTRSKDLGVIGINRGAIWALHAARLKTGVNRVHEIDSPGKWADHVGNPESRLFLSDIVPGVLADYDLDDLRNKTAE